MDVLVNHIFHLKIFYFTEWLPKYAICINGNSNSIEFFMNQNYIDQVDSV